MIRYPPLCALQRTWLSARRKHERNAASSLRIYTYPATFCRSASPATWFAFFHRYFIPSPSQPRSKRKAIEMPFPQHHLGRQLRLTAKRSPLPGSQTRAPAPKVSISTARMGMTTLPPFTAHQFNHMLNKVPTNYREKASRTTFRQEQAGLLAGFWACSLVGFGCMYTTALLLEENDDGEGLAASLFGPKLVETGHTHISRMGCLEGVC